MSASMVERLRRSEVTQVANALLQARRERRPVDATPLADMLRDAQDAYAVQALVAQELYGVDAQPSPSWKSGGPSREAVATHAALPPQGVWRSPADARSWHCNIRLVEVEIALRLGRAVTPDEAAAMSHEAATQCVDAMAVAIELVDSRWVQGVQAPALLKLADLQSHGALVLDDWIAFAPRDWSAQEVSVCIGTSAPREFRGSHSTRDPTWILPAWLRHATRGGDSVARGTVVTTGTWCGMLSAVASDLVVARFDGVGEASVQL